MSRHRARIAVLETLYQLDSRPADAVDERVVDEICDESLQRHGVSTDDSSEFGRTLARGSWENRSETDRIISDLSRGWALHRIGRLERAIMRMALQEMRCMDIPPSVAINEAVELTKRYVSERAASFVNGILGSTIVSETVEEE
ncbi:MAG: transcription antitermination factor NusB [Bacillota bacterium]